MKLTFIKNSKMEDHIILDVYLNERTYQMLLEYCKRNSLDLATGFARAVERGMKFFRATRYNEMKRDYLRLKKQAEEYARDNKVLRNLVEGNERFRQILNTTMSDSKGKGHES